MNAKSSPPGWMMVSFRLPKNVVDAIDELAAREYRSRTSMVVGLLNEALDHRELTIAAVAKPAIRSRARRTTQSRKARKTTR